LSIMLMPLMVAASIDWTRHHHLCLKQTLESCCQSQPEKGHCDEGGHLALFHIEEGCDDKSCCTEQTVVIDQSITDLAEGQHYAFSWFFVADWAKVEMPVFSGFKTNEVNTDYLNKPPPEAKKPPRVLYSCFRC